MTVKILAENTESCQYGDSRRNDNAHYFSPNRLINFSHISNQIKWAAVIIMSTS